jgi:hypothetical protein
LANSILFLNLPLSNIFSDIYFKCRDKIKHKETKKTKY